MSKSTPVQTTINGWNGAFYPLNLKTPNEIYDGWERTKTLTLIESVATIISPKAKVLLDIKSVDKPGEHYHWPYCIEIPGINTTFRILFPHLNISGGKRSIALFSKGPSSRSSDSKLIKRLKNAMVIAKV